MIVRIFLNRIFEKELKVNYRSSKEIYQCQHNTKLQFYKTRNLYLSFIPYFPVTEIISKDFPNYQEARDCKVV
jgi:hypothetical protein